jgi:hypothetical protein
MNIVSAAEREPVQYTCTGAEFHPGNMRFYDDFFVSSVVLVREPHDKLKINILKCN